MRQPAAAGRQGRTSFRSCWWNGGILCSGGPFLEFDDVPFRIGGIDDLDAARTGNGQRHLAADCSASSRLHCCERTTDIVDGKGDMGKARPIRGWRESLRLLIILKDLESRTIRPMPRKTQVNAPQMGTVDPGGLFEPLAG